PEGKWTGNLCGSELHTFLRLSTANWRRFFSRLLDHGHNPSATDAPLKSDSGATEISSCSVDFRLTGRHAAPCGAVSCFKPRCPKAGIRCFWLSAIRARRRGPWSPDWLLKMEWRWHKWMALSSPE